MACRRNETKQSTASKNISHERGVFCYNTNMQTNTIKRVGILRGGAGEHYHSSLKRGGEIISHLFENLSHKYKVIDILADRNHIWHLGGLPISPSDLAHQVDVVWNTSHPSFSNILNSLSISNIGANSFTHVLKNNKKMLREHVKDIGLQMPKSIFLPLYQKDFDGPREKYSIKKAKEVFEKFGPSWIVKSRISDSGMGVYLAKTFNELVAGIEDKMKYQASILVEEFITGKIISIHSVPEFRGEDIYTFPIINTEARPQGLLSLSEKKILSDIVKKLHYYINARHYLKSDFVLTPKGKIYLLEIDETPDLKLKSHFSQSCESIGAKMHDVVEHILEHGQNQNVVP